MTTPGWKWILFAGSILFQWYILASWIYREEQTIAQGIFIRIPCQQLDPKDPFRGTYLHVNPIPAQFEFEDSALYRADQSIWINYTQESGNQYRFHSVQPGTDQPQMPIYIQARIGYIYPVYPDSVYSASIIYPFSNLFVNEKAAPQLVERYNKALSDTTTKVYAGMYVLRGKASLEGLWIGDQRLE